MNWTIETYIDDALKEKNIPKHRMQYKMKILQFFVRKIRSLELQSRTQINPA